MFNIYDEVKKKIKIQTEYPYFCEVYFNDTNKKCRKFYETLSGNEDTLLVKCPYGFSCLKTEQRIYTSLIINGNSDFIKVKKHLEIYQENLKDFTAYSVSQLFKLVKGIEQLEELKDIYSQTVHDIKNANKSMIDLSESIEQNETIQDILMNNPDLYSLVEGYGLINYRLDYHDWAVNKSVPYNRRSCSINLHKIITKLKFQLKYRALKKNIKMQIVGATYNELYQHVALFLGFFLLMENAIKYSLTYKEIVIELKDISETETQVRIVNTCLAISEEEIQQLKKKGFRSQAAISSANGKGLGLNLADTIFSDSQSRLDVCYEAVDEGQGKFIAETIIRTLEEA